MYDSGLVVEILIQIETALSTVHRRFVPVKSANDFTDSDDGMEKLDAICMQLIAIGESLKNIDKITNRSLLHKYADVEWDKIKGLRDIISHHYFDIDAEVIYDICKHHLGDVTIRIQQMIKDISHPDNSHKGTK